MIFARRKGREGQAPAHAPPSPFLGLRYPILVAALAIPLFVVYSYPYAEDGLMAAATQRYLSGYATMVGAVLSLLDPHVIVSANRIAGRFFSMTIVKTCDAMEVNILLLSALVAFPMGVLRRLVAAVVAMVAIVILNVLRLCVLFWLGMHAPTWFDRTHQTLAPLVLVACAVGVFLMATSRTDFRTPVRPAAMDKAAE